MENKALTTTQETQPTMNHSERFSSMVLREYGSQVGNVDLADTQRQLIQGYFIGIDRALKLAEDARMRKKDDKRDPVPIIWENVNLQDLAIDVFYHARMGLDMQMDNHLWAIPYKNNKTGKYDITLMKGYNGIKYLAEKYAVDKPVSVTIELVYSTDTFVPLKRNKDNSVESYTFEICSPFDRGQIVGGFGYIEYAEPTKNKLIIMTMEQIIKRKPEYASPEFWGGTKPVWENGRKTGEKEIPGWLDEMCLKTIIREVYSARHIPRDPAKIDENYRFLKRRDAEYIAALETNAIADYDTADVIDITPESRQHAITAPIDSVTGEILPTQEPINAGQPSSQSSMQMGF